MSAAVIWVDESGELHATAHRHDEDAQEHAEKLWEGDGLNVVVVYDFEVEGDGGRD